MLNLVAVSLWRDGGDHLTSSRALGHCERDHPQSSLSNCKGFPVKSIHVSSRIACQIVHLVRNHKQCIYFLMSSKWTSRSYVQELYLQQSETRKASLINLQLSLTFEGLIWKTPKELSELATEHAFSSTAMLHMQSKLSQLPWKDFILILWLTRKMNIKARYTLGIQASMFVLLVESPVMQLTQKKSHCNTVQWTSKNVNYYVIFH